MPQGVARGVVEIGLAPRVQLKCRRIKHRIADSGGCGGGVGIVEDVAVVVKQPLVILKLLLVNTRTIGSCYCDPGQFASLFAVAVQCHAPYRVPIAVFKHQTGNKYSARHRSVVAEHHGTGARDYPRGHFLVAKQCMVFVDGFVRYTLWQPCIFFSHSGVVAHRYGFCGAVVLPLPHRGFGIFIAYGVGAFRKYDAAKQPCGHGGQFVARVHAEWLVAIGGKFTLRKFVAGAVGGGDAEIAHPAITRSYQFYHIVALRCLHYFPACYYKLAGAARTAVAVAVKGSVFAIVCQIIYITNIGICGCPQLKCAQFVGLPYHCAVHRSRAVHTPPKGNQAGFFVGGECPHTVGKTYLHRV